MTSQEWIAKKPFMSGDELLMCCDLTECEKARDEAVTGMHAAMNARQGAEDSTDEWKARAEKAEAESAALRSSPERSGGTAGGVRAPSCGGEAGGMSGEERYQFDPVFRSLVDMIEIAVERQEYTPSEVRDAAMLAAIHYEQRHLRPMLIGKDGKAEGRGT